MPDLIRHPEHTEITGFPFDVAQGGEPVEPRPSPEWQQIDFLTFYGFIKIEQVNSDWSSEVFLQADTIPRHSDK